MKIKIASELLDSTYRGSLKNAGVYLEISLSDCLTTKEIQDFYRTFSKFQQNSRTFQDFPGLFSNSRTFQDWWEPCYGIWMKPRIQQNYEIVTKFLNISI